MDTASFLHRILPAAGVKLLAELVTYKNERTGETEEGWRYHKFDDIEAMAEAVAQFDSAGRTVYHACNSFGDWYEDLATGKRRIRTIRNVKACRALYDDVDCGAEKAAEGLGYATKNEAAAAVQAFIGATRLPKPMVVDSGGGLHLYWPMAADVAPQMWLAMAELKRRLTTHLKLRTDRACDTDLARVLRPAGATNRKKEAPRPVVLKRDCEPIHPEVLLEALNAAVERLGAPMLPTVKAKAAASIANPFGALLERDYPDSFADIVADHCATIRWFKETGAPDEPLWHKCVGVVKHCEDGREKIHAWSSHYAGYDAAETDAKIDQWSYGPATCTAIQSCSGNRCDGCAHKSDCVTPLRLGYKNEAPAPELEKIVEAPVGVVEIDKDELLKTIWPANVRKDGNGLSRAVENPETGEVSWVLFSTSVFYPSDLIRNEEGVWEVTVEYFTQYHTKRHFTMPTENAASADKLAGALAAHTIFLPGKNGKVFAMDHLKSMVLGLQKHRQEIITEETFGWNAEGNAFIIGANVIDEDGKAAPARLSDHIKSSGLGVDFGAAGSRDEWVRLVHEIYDRPGAEMYQFAILAAAASPLVAMVGLSNFHGLPVAFTGDGGRGKTSACRIACSMWGRGDLFEVSSNKAGSTINGLLAMLAIYRHLPVIMDEMTGQSFEQMAEMLYAMSNGQSKRRLNSAGTFAGKHLRWDNIGFISGNMDITGGLATLDRQMAEAVQVRCFEIKVPSDINETVFKGVDFKQLGEVELAQNYGVVGRELIRLYLKNRAKIVTLVHKLRQEFQPSTADETRERFYIDLICFALAAGKIMKAKDLIRFDLDAIRKWAFANVKSLRANRAERRYSDNDAVGDFINALHERTITTKHLLDMRRQQGTPEVPLGTVRGEPWARKATVDKKFFISARAIGEWAKENGTTATTLRSALDRMGYVVHRAGRSESGNFVMQLGQGTTQATGRTKCYELDFSKVHGLTAISGAPSGEVIRLHQEVTEAVISTGTEAV